MGACIRKEVQVEQEINPPNVKFDDLFQNQSPEESPMVEESKEQPLRSYCQRTQSEKTVNRNGKSTFSHEHVRHTQTRPKRDESEGPRTAIGETEFSDINHMPQLEEEKQAETRASNLMNGAQENLSGPKLVIEVENSKYGKAIKELIQITPHSINGRMKSESKFYFGRDSGGRSNDYNLEDESIGSRQFELSYNKDSSKFFVIDNKKGTGLFVKIIGKIKISHDMIVSFCASHMILQIEADPRKFPLTIESPGHKRIRVKFLHGPNQNQERIFSSRDKKIVRIGRSKNNEIVYKDDSVSRVQCTLIYQDKDWYLYDGHTDNGNKGSTNGLWQLASTKILLTDQMMLKTGNTTLKVRLQE